MRKFFLLIHKSIMLSYFVLMMCMLYGNFMEQIPDELFVEEGEDMDDILMPGLSLKFLDNEDDISSLTFNDIKGNSVKSFAQNDNSKEGEMTCLLWGIFPIKTVHVQTIDDKSVFASGRLVGIYEHMDGVLVLDEVSFKNDCGTVVEPAKDKVMKGDYITAIDGKLVKTKEEIAELVNSGKGGFMRFSILRGEEEIETLIQPEKSSDGNYLAGIWIKDDLAGIGTVTYYTSNGEFGALGHGIGDGVTENLLSVKDGDLYNMSLQKIEKGEVGTPGQISGTIYFGNDSHIGHLSNNLNIGIYGELDNEDYVAYSEVDNLYEVAHKQEIEVGKAQIICEVSGKLRNYDIEIKEVDLGTKDKNKGIVLKVTDPDLIEITGGIIQGMSGSPIIQNGKIVGAITHVFVNDPTQGYGIFLEEMLEK